MLYPVPILSPNKMAQSFISVGLSRRQWHLSGYQDPSWYCSGAGILSSICEKHKNRDGNITIMLPFYFCGQSLRHLRSMKATLVFYGLDEELTPNFKDIEEVLNNVVPTIFLHVHYFGRVLEQDKVRRLCNAYNMLMVEDCAHVIHPRVEARWQGDYVFFCPHKFFPVKNGSVLYERESSKKNFVQRKVPFPIFWYLKKYISSFKQKRLMNCEVQWNSLYEDDSFLAPSDLELGLLQSSALGVESIARKRVGNRKKLLEVLTCFDQWHTIIPTDDTYIPYILGMRCDSIEVAESLCKDLAYFYCPMMRWPDLPSELLSVDGSCESDIELANLSIFFFVHEQLDINKYIGLISKAIRRNTLVD